ncbi:Sugar-specific transcriptional regulator TrmB [Methanomethylovorans hollandica DSM 15978]|jgi:predicted transcriptional regulator|uniref:Sugar-specific transcriptional regulator TrmB n=1 Tax=Methanomethylovorans hollandica (strain DSM 15978 / NBRC 107637 / DMS1) TaxID=867904 RepID=L0KWZ7_METHD|nr:helix-turn-helix domain-containing protein [Methanomethylovorans hollandica]AGB48494.1 Sugar-specific transcriptional regulator TrmB [Methanomethylovorans hollandica DSM 15978]
MEELVGFVTGNNNRKKLLSLLGSKKEMDSERIAKTMHIFRPSVDKIIEELVEKELVEKQGANYKLTDLGATVERTIQNI